jgi:alpha-L-fucosidase
MWYRWKGPIRNPSVAAFMEKFYPPEWTYVDFAPEFRAELYGKHRSFFSLFFVSKNDLLDPNEWADIFAASGAKYIHIIPFLK